MVYTPTDKLFTSDNMSGEWKDINVRIGRHRSRNWIDVLVRPKSLPRRDWSVIVQTEDLLI